MKFNTCTINTVRVEYLVHSINKMQRQVLGCLRNKQNLFAFMLD